MKINKRFESLSHNCNNTEIQENVKQTRNHKIRYEQNVPHQFSNDLMPVNAFEQKDRFLRRNLTPEFLLKLPSRDLEASLFNAVRWNYLF